jgi:hypothetical protein
MKWVKMNSESFFCCSFSFIFISACCEIFVIEEERETEKGGNLLDNIFTA